MPKATKKRTSTKKSSEEANPPLEKFASTEAPPTEPAPKKAQKKKLDPRYLKIRNIQIKQTSPEEESHREQLAESIVQVDDAQRGATQERIKATTDSILEQVLTTGKPSFEIPSRSSSNIVWDEVRDLLLLGEKLIKRPFHSLASVLDATRLMKLIEVVNELLLKDIHATKREIYYHDVDLFEDQKYSDKTIEDLAAMLKVIRNSTHVVASAKGACIGRLRIRDNGDLIDLERGSGGWSISPFLDRIEIVESDAEFILVVEKDAALIRLSEAKWWEDYPCIILTGKGAADIATRMFLRMLEKELKLPCFCLVDSDPYGHYIYSVYLRGSKRLSYESPFLATPNLHLIGVLSRDLDQFGIPKNCLLNMTKTDLKRTREMLDEDFVKKNLNWVEDLELMLNKKKKAEIQAFSSHGFEYITDNYLPTKLSTGDWI